MTPAVANTWGLVFPPLVIVAVLVAMAVVGVRERPASPDEISRREAARLDPAGRGREQG